MGGGLGLIGAQPSPGKFAPLIINEKTSNGAQVSMSIQHIAAKDNGPSQEEIRFNDYKTGANRGGGTSGFAAPALSLGGQQPVPAFGGGFQLSATGGFAPSPLQQPAPIAFAPLQQQQTGLGFAAPATTGFGTGFAAAAPRVGTFGAQTAAPAQFGSFASTAQAPGPFAPKVASPQAFGVFSAAAPASAPFAAPAASASSPFGNLATMGAFGAPVAAPSFVAPAPSLAFGSPAAQPPGNLAFKPAAMAGFTASAFAPKPATPGLSSFGQFAVPAISATTLQPGAPTQVGTYGAQPQQERPADDTLEQIQRSIRERSRDHSARTVDVEDIDDAPPMGLANKILPAYRYTTKTAARRTPRGTSGSDWAQINHSSSHFFREPPMSILSPEHLLSRGSKIVISSNPVSHSARASEREADARALRQDDNDRWSGVSKAGVRMLEAAREYPMRSEAASGLAFVDRVIGEAAPTFTKQGYSTSPPIESLREMSEKELSRVYNFEISHEYGCIKWDIVDLRHVNLDDIITIGHGLFDVYPDDYKNKPPVGQGLNKPARLTYLKFSEADEDYLNEMCQSMDASLFSNDPKKGICVVDVKHFTKYRLASRVPKVVLPVEQLHMPVDADADTRLDSSAPTSRMSDDMHAGHDDDDADVGMAGDEGGDDDQMVTAGDYSSQQSFVPFNRRGFRQPYVYHSQSVLDDVADVATHDAGSFSDGAVEFPHAAISAPRSSRRPVAESACMEIFKRVLREKTGSTAFETTRVAGALHKGKGIKDFSLSMGRSFRVGWGPNGQLVHAGRAVSADQGHIIEIEKVDTLSSSHSRHSSQGGLVAACDVPTLFRGPLEALLSCSSWEASQVGAPLWKSPVIYDTDGDKERKGTPTKKYNIFLSFLHRLQSSFAQRHLSPEHPDWSVKKAVDLVNAMCGQEQDKLDSMKKQVPLFERMDGDTPALWECRREALSNWLQEICLPEGESTQLSWKIHVSCLLPYDFPTFTSTSTH